MRNRLFVSGAERKTRREVPTPTPACQNAAEWLAILDDLERLKGRIESASPDVVSHQDTLAEWLDGATEELIRVRPRVAG